VFLKKFEEKGEGRLHWEEEDVQGQGNTDITKTEFQKKKFKYPNGQGHDEEE